MVSKWFSVFWFDNDVGDVIANSSDFTDDEGSGSVPISGSLVLEVIHFDFIFLQSLLDESDQFLPGTDEFRGGSGSKNIFEGSDQSFTENWVVFRFDSETNMFSRDSVKMHVHGFKVIRSLSK